MSEDSMRLIAVLILLLIVGVILIIWFIFFPPGSASIVPPFITNPLQPNIEGNGQDINQANNKLRNGFKNIFNPNKKSEAVNEEINVDVYNELNNKRNENQIERNGKNIGFDEEERICEINSEDIDFSDIENRYSGIDIECEEEFVDGKIPSKRINKRRNPNK